MQMGQVYRRARNHPSMHGVWKTWWHGSRRAGSPSSNFSRQMTLGTVSSGSSPASPYRADTRKEERAGL